MSNNQNLLRNHLRQQRQRLSPLRRHLDSVRIATTLSCLIPAQTTVASYVSTHTEVSTRHLHRLLNRKEVRLLLPVVRPNHKLEFVPYNYGLKYQNSYGIGEPRYSAPRARKLQSGNIIITPLLGFDQQCNRMGMGGGYYDRLLARHTRTRSIGIAFTKQQLRAVPRQPWDQALNTVVTSTKVFNYSRQK